MEFGTGGEKEVYIYIYMSLFYRFACMYDITLSVWSLMTKQTTIINTNHVTLKSQ